MQYVTWIDTQIQARNNETWRLTGEGNVSTFPALENDNVFYLILAAANVIRLIWNPLRI